MSIKKVKKVAIVVCAWPPNGGGIGNNAYYQAFKLSEIGYEVGVFTLNFKGIKKISYPFSFNSLKSFFTFGKAGIMLSLISKLKKYEIIHLYYPFFGSDLLVAWVKYFNPKIKLIIHYQMDPLADGFKGFIFRVYMNLFFPIIVRLSDRIGVLSYDHAENSYLKKYLNKYKDKFFELPNGIDSKKFYPKEKDQVLLNLYKINPNDKVLIFAGGLDKQHYFKGVPELLKAVAKINISFFPDILNNQALKGSLNNFKGDLKVLIIGDGDLRKEFEDLTKELKIENRVNFLGWIDNDELPKYYCLGDVFVLPSTVAVESFGIVVAEAQSCGLPVVVSDLPGVRKTLENKGTGLLVKPNDIEDLVEKIKLILSDSKLNKDFAQAGRLRAESKYDWQIIVKLLDKLYQSL